ncbi:MAG: glycosyltransferase [Bacteroidetes bacterium]|uniref:Glycosyltransferase n=1 Tax=Candidatus Enterocola intestinipullorum TaxID=2840783 RepID=A0A9D9EH32_9BACT|nr:glycosyltransferase [Candidatus Enterocola intestinipullorum]
MRILIVASYNKGRFAPFITEQAEALSKNGAEIDYFGVVGKGLAGYLKNIRSLKQKIEDFQPDIVHAHYGLSGLLANLQRKVPVVTTYHGSDINDSKVLRLSKIAMRLSAWNIFVSKKNVEMSGLTGKYSLLPCGIDTDNFAVKEMAEARKELGWKMDGQYVLFAGAFDNAVKNAALAQAAVALLPGVDLVEMKGFSRQQVASLFYAADVFLMTSKSEGSPQVVKEALYCGCPIVSVDVGDVAEVTEGILNCYIAKPVAEDLSQKLRIVLASPLRTQGRTVILAKGMDNKTVATKLLDIYNLICKH